MIKAGEFARFFGVQLFSIRIRKFKRLFVSKQTFEIKETNVCLPQNLRLKLDKQTFEFGCSSS
jgi:hypothetical protein